MKWLVYVILAVLLSAGWFHYFHTGGERRDLIEKLDLAMDKGDPEGKAGRIQQQIHSLEGQRTFVGLSLAFVSAGVAGILFVLHILPGLAHRLTHAIYDSSEMMETDVMHDARSLVAQGEYEGAIESFKLAAEAEPLNRLPWVEIVKIYKDHLGDPASAIATLQYVLEKQEWEVNDAAYFLFRLAELYDEVNGDRDSAIAIMQQVVEEFPSTRHSANAKHKLQEWEHEAQEAAAAAAEQEYLDQMNGAEEPHEEAGEDSGEVGIVGDGNPGEFAVEPDVNEGVEHEAQPKEEFAPEKPA